MTKITAVPIKAVDTQPTVKELVDSSGKSATKLASELKASLSTVYQWIRLNRLPPKRLVPFAVAVGVTPWDVMHFMEVERKPWGSYQVLPKSKMTLATLVRVQEGTMDVATACALTGLPERAVRTVLANWPGERLRFLQTVLEKLEAKELDLAGAAALLGVAKPTLHGLRRRYGYCPGSRRAPKKPLGPYKANAILHRDLALEVIRGRKSARAAALESGQDLRTLHRHIATHLRPLTLNELAHWSASNRLALAHEIEQRGPKYVVEWRQRAEKSGVLLRRVPYKLAKVADWRQTTVVRMAAEIFSGELTLQRLARLRGGDPDRIKDLIDGVLLKQLGVSYTTIMGLSVHHQDVVGEYLAAILRNQTQSGPEP